MKHMIRFFGIRFFGRRRAALLLCAGLLVLAAGGAAAQDAGFGAGVVLGEPTGLSAKYWLSGNDAVDFAAAWSFYRRAGKDNDDRGALYLHGSYLRHFFGLIDGGREGRLVPYAGIGGKVAFSDDFYLGVRFPLGLAYMFRRAPLDIFLEISPALILVPGTAFDAGAGLGVRYWFK